MLDLRAEGLCTKTDLHSSGSALIQCIHVRIDSNCCTNYFYLEADLELLELNFMDYVWHFTYNLKLSTLFMCNTMSSWTGRRAVSNVHIWGKRWHQLLCCTWKFEGIKLCEVCDTQIWAVLCNLSNKSCSYCCALKVSAEPCSIPGLSIWINSCVCVWSIMSNKPLLWK